jgi:hypothetical protein
MFQRGRHEATRDSEGADVSERKAEWLDTFGARSNYLFARHKETGRRISARQFYRLPGDRGSMEREGYVLMTTAAQPKEEGDPKQGDLF